MHLHSSFRRILSYAVSTDGRQKKLALAMGLTPVAL